MHNSSEETQWKRDDKNENPWLICCNKDQLSLKSLPFSRMLNGVNIDCKIQLKKSSFFLFRFWWLPVERWHHGQPWNLGKGDRVLQMMLLLLLQRMKPISLSIRNPFFLFFSLFNSKMVSSPLSLLAGVTPCLVRRRILF